MKKNFFESLSYNHADFYLEGESYFKRYLQLIDEAREVIHLQTYIFEMDTFGSAVHAALVRALVRGVRVFLLIDSVGSKAFAHADEVVLSSAGAVVCRFNGIHFRWLYQWGRRLHHKILLVDSARAIVGGINVTASGYGSLPRSGQTISPQLDFAVLIRGPVTFELVQYCQSVFQKADRHNKYLKFPEMAPGDVQGGNLEPRPGMALKVSINDWIFNRWQITRGYARMTTTAQKEITIVNSYFFPRRKFMQQLVAARRRGVRVRLILPALSDWPSYILASEYLYAYFLKNGVEIYQWNKSVLHGKLALVDGAFCTIGSFNLNYTSYQQNLEMNIDIANAEFTTSLTEVIEEIIHVGCVRVDPVHFIEHVSYKTKALRFLFHAVLSVIASFSVAITYREHAQRKNRYLHTLRLIAAATCFFVGLVGVFVPAIPAVPFFVLGLVLSYRELLFTKKLRM